LSIRRRDTSLRVALEDDYATQHCNHDLIDAENVRARSIAGAVDGNIDLAKTLAKKDAPIKIINELLRLSNILLRSLSVRAIR